MEDPGLAPPELRTRLAKAMSHPLRVRLLMAYNDRVTSPRELAEALDEPLSTVSYHTQHLFRSGLLELVRTEQKRGATKHYYRALVRDEVYDHEWAKLPEPVRRGIAGTVLDGIWHDLREAHAAGDLERAGVHLARTPLELDEQAWQQLSALLIEVGAAAFALQDESRRRSHADRRRRSTLALLHFPTSD
jgi:DNA-binding transcriptional ArsR family regulator